MCVEAFNKAREICLNSIVELIKLPYIKLFHKKRVPWDITELQLSKFESDTLGRRLLEFLTKNNLSLQALYESHDIYHVLSGYEIGMVNEAKLFFFLLGNGKKSISVLGSVLVAFVIYPDYWSSFKVAYEHGNTFKPIFEINFELELHKDFSQLQQSLRR